MSEGEDVYIYLYDLTGGLASRISLPLIGKKVEGIWHTGVVVYGKEYYFGSGGVGIATPDTVVGHPPIEKIHIGKTFIPEEVFHDYVSALNQSSYSGSTYDLIRHNCNNFSDEVSKFLVGSGIPEYILNLPHEILNTPFGETFRGLIEQISRSSPSFAARTARPESPGLHQLNSEIEEVRRKCVASEEKRNALNEKLARRERRRIKKLKKDPTQQRHLSEVSVDRREMSVEGDSSVVVDRLAEEQQLEEEEKRQREIKRRNREPPIVFKDAVDVHIEFDSLVGLIDGKLNEEEQQALEELHQYMLQDEGSWALGDGFLAFVGRVLREESEASVRLLNVLTAAALKEDVILMLHQDRRQHVLMNYAFDVDTLPLPQQKALTLFMCNLFENGSSSEWLLYISEWQYKNTSISNMRVTTKVTVNAILSGDPELRERGTAILYNLATKEVKSVVFDDVAVELTMAILEVLGGSPTEGEVWRCLKALLKFSLISSQDVPQLVHMIGPHPSKFKGQSDRNDTLIQEISRIIK